MCLNQSVVKKAQVSGASYWYFSVNSALYSNWYMRSRMQVDVSVITLGGCWDLFMPDLSVSDICFMHKDLSIFHFTCSHPVGRVKSK